MIFAAAPLYHQHERPIVEMIQIGSIQVAGPKFVAYFRVSTKRQGRSGLGIEAQREVVTNYILSRGGSLLGEHTEQESGKRKDRPELARALAVCRLHRATLVVAKLDRLARNAAFLLSLRESGADFIACDMPAMNRMTVGIMAVVAEEEARMISERTRVALRAAKRRGVRLGKPENLSDAARLVGSATSATIRAEAANRRSEDLVPLIDCARAVGATSLREIARALDQQGITTSRGCGWTAAAVARVLRRATARECRSSGR